MAAVQIPHPVSRPSMDRNPSSFDQPRSRSTPPFAQHTYERSTSPNIGRPGLQHHSRTSSNASSQHSPYQQPYGLVSGSYFVNPAAHPNMYQPQQQAWPTQPLPATAFYSPQLHQYPGQVFPQGFQQSQPDFAAWTNAYHHMVAASMAPPLQPPQPEYLDSTRRRTSSGPSSVPSHQSLDHYSQQYQSQGSSAKPAPQPYHPYKRGPTHQTSRENVKSSAIPRSVSHSALQSDRHSPSDLISRQNEAHRRTSSMDTAPVASVPTPKVPSRTGSLPLENVSPPVAAAPVTVARVAPPPANVTNPVKSTARPAQAAAAPLPLHTGPIANAANASANRPSPLSQAAVAPSPEPEKKMGGLRGRLKKALERDATTPKKQSSTPSSVAARSAPPQAFTSPSETSTRSATPPTTPPQHDDYIRPPSAPFVSHPSALNSDVSLAETERTATAPSEMGQGQKSKRSLFRMKNMSTDNISLSSTVSSASMMIRKMGSLGKLARRNSLMGISKIFKDKPSDEDAALPEKKESTGFSLGKKKKKAKDAKNAKAEAAPATISTISAEVDRDVGLGDDDRALAGLSPAAKLARQHTLRSKAKDAKGDQEVRRRTDSQTSTRTGEPAWDNNTTTRTNQAQQAQSASSVRDLPAGAAAPKGSTGPEVLHVTPGRTSTVVHAVNVSEHEYDSDDDSSDGETVEDVTVQVGKVRLSDSSTADREFREAWGNAYIDRNAVPRKGILKTVISFEKLEALGASEASANRQRSASSAQVPSHNHSGPMSIPQADPNQIDGLHHPSAHHLNGAEDPYDPFSPSFSPFDTTPKLGTSPYGNPAMNTSAPTLPTIGQKPPAARSMTVPARKRLIWAPECAVYSTYDPGTYDRRSEPATCNRLTPALAMEIKAELNAFKLEMPVHPASRNHTHYFV